MKKACAMENNFLRFVEYVKLSFWDTKRYLHNISIGLNKGTLLSDVLKPYKKSVSKEEIIKNGWQIISKINFGGELFLREFEEIEKYKGNLFLVPENTIIYSKINVRHGCIYFNEIDNIPFCVSSEYPVFVIDENKVKGKFLQRLLRTNEFKKLLNIKATGISKARVKQDEFLNIQIPLPSLDEQEAIVSAYQSKINEAQQLENEAQQLENEIEKYLFEELGVSFQKYENLQSGKLHFVEFKDMESWGVSNNFSDSPSNIFQSKKYPLISIQNFFLINPTTNISVDEEISFIPMASVSDEYGEIIKKENRKLAKGYTRFQENDILWARITPCMENGKSSIAKELKNGFGFGSTEFHILRKFSNGLNEELLHLLLRTSHLRQNAKKYFTGSAGQQRVPKSYLENLKIPIPPLPKQNEIAATIATMKQTQKQKTETATRLRAEALAEFEQVIFS